jgi:hypothetical protein
MSPSNGKSEAASRPLRAVGIFILDLLGAVIVPAILEGAVWRILPAHSLITVVVKEWCLDLAVAAFMGSMMYRVWRSGTSKWAWTLPALWFAFRAVPYAAHSHPESVLSHDASWWAHFSGGSCASPAMDCRDFFAFSVPLIRSISYSVAASITSRFLKSHSRTSNPYDHPKTAAT